MPYYTLEDAEALAAEGYNPKYADELIDGEECVLKLGGGDEPLRRFTVSRVETVKQYAPSIALFADTPLREARPLVRMFCRYESGAVLPETLPAGTVLYTRPGPEMTIEQDLTRWLDAVDAAVETEEAG